MTLTSAIISFNFICIFKDSINGFYLYPFKGHEHIHNSCFKVLACVSAMLHFSGLTVVGFLSFGKNILSCVLMIMASGFGIVDIDICSCLCWLGIPFLDSVAPPGS